MSIHRYILLRINRFIIIIFYIRYEVAPIPKEHFAFEYGYGGVSLVTLFERNLFNAGKGGELLRGKENVGNILSGLAVHRIMAMCVAVAARTTGDDVR